MQGDIIGLYNSNFEQIVTYTYDSWGKVLSVRDNFGNEIIDSNHIGLINPFRYRSYYYDEETKLYYLNSRYYNPEWCRFVNADNLIGTTDKIITYNLYSYCENNPIIMKDYDGKITGIDDAVFWVGVGLVTVLSGLYVYNKYKDDIAKGLANIATGVMETIQDIGNRFNEEREKQNKKQYDDTPDNYVYTLVNPSGSTIYVGRTNNIEATKLRHQNNPFRNYLKMEEILGPMPKAAARVEEEAMILKYKTLNSGEKGCNKIHGLSPNFPGYDEFMYAARTIGDESLTFVGGCNGR